MLNEEYKDHSSFSGRVRARVCGILREEDRILMIRHKSLGPEGFLWIPPGGGIEFGENAEEALKREFLEETNLNVDVSQFLFTYEMINDQHHAIELFFEVSRLGGDIALGSDPELAPENQMIDELQFLDFREINQMNKGTLHGIFSEVESAEKVLELRGLFSFKH